MTRAPLIGLTLDIEPGGPQDFSRWPYHALRQNYFEAIATAGGLPVGLPHDVRQAPLYMERLDGLVVTGGAFDPDPALYGAARHPRTTLKPGRTQAELACLEAARALGLPILGICGGMQLMAIAWGGSLHQHLPEDRPGPVAHEQPNPRDEAGHDVSILPGTLLARHTGLRSMAVNSSHHQGVSSPGALRIGARAPDGLIEAVETTDGIFRLGVQWHPEFAIDPGDARLLAGFIDAARHARPQDKRS
ncbi:gamma-glutamyl-gamma-aminobutyrate hydrolase family protein [Swaminathania salitolerans]|uniref:Gamma-glutamyl-gamma-aminobutyrate hydrolase n=1 Tax=Swaminathania salitolerans TaxID=182838 RepID=A0A511BT13_9PROT|nr:gamma-glutamyl-gamma-aminobutyrate hydrolase family protein [Swaminathania salitolerans]GEL02724.1 gamma-glutamyl-gamma-aminobutyrate hydrolase [Swaminathania salitolerans]